MALAIVGVCLLTAACASPTPRGPLPLTSTPPFSSTEGIDRPQRWWEAFEDPHLATQIEKGLRGNYGLGSALARIESAQALARREGAALTPALSNVATGDIEDRDGQKTFGEFGLGLVASYELDLWGRIRSGALAATLDASATAEDFQTIALGLSAEIATVVYRLVEARAQLDLVDSQLKTNGEVSQVILARFGSGRSGSADVFRQRQLVESTREQRIVEQAVVDVLEHQLAVLTGEPPQTATSEGLSRELPVLPGLPEIGLPSELLSRRPDVRAAFLRLESADQAVAAAVRDRYPRFDLSAAVSTAGGTAADLFSSWLTSLAGQIFTPLIDGGRRVSEVERTEAVRKRRLAEYGETVLNALREVEDALALERRQSERIASLERQLDLANTTYSQLRIQYLNGAADFLDILTTLRGQQALERDLLEARLLRIENRIALHRVIAGALPAETLERDSDWDREEP